MTCAIATRAALFGATSILSASALFLSCTTARGASLSFDTDVGAYAGLTPQEQDNHGTSITNIGQVPGVTELDVGASSDYTGCVLAEALCASGVGIVTLGSLEAAAYTTGYAEFGSLHALAQSSVLLTFPYDPFNTMGTHHPVIVNYASRNVYGSAFFQASFSDDLNWTGPGEFASGGDTGYGRIGHQSTRCDRRAGYAGQFCPGREPVGEFVGGTLIDPAGSGLDNQWQYYTVTGIAGTPFPVSEQLTAESNIHLCEGVDECNDPYDSGDELLDQSYVSALNTASFSVEVLTPGVTYVADSGTIYPTTLPPEGGDPVPEPAGFALFGVGLFGLGFIRHRKRRHRACL